MANDWYSFERAVSCWFWKFWKSSLKNVYFCFCCCHLNWCKSLFVWPFSKGKCGLCDLSYWLTLMSQNLILQFCFMTPLSFQRNKISPEGFSNVLLLFWYMQNFKISMMRTQIKWLFSLRWLILNLSNVWNKFVFALIYYLSIQFKTIKYFCWIKMHCYLFLQNVFFNTKSIHYFFNIASCNGKDILFLVFYFVCKRLGTQPKKCWLLQAGRI